MGDLGTWTGVVVAILVAALPIWLAHPRLRVTLTLEHRNFSIMWWLNEGPPEPEPYVIVRAINTGQRTVALESWEIVGPEGVALTIPYGKWGSTMSLPTELPPDRHKVCECYLSPSDLTQIVRGAHMAGVVWLRGRYRDHSGKTYTSKPFRFDSDQWL